MPRTPSTSPCPARRTATTGTGDGFRCPRTLFSTPLRGWDIQGAVGLPTDLPERTTDVAADLRRTAAEKVHAFLRERVLIAGDGVLVRATGPLALAVPNAAKSDYNHFRIEPFPALAWHRSAGNLDKHSTAKSLGEFPFRPDTLDEFHELIHEYEHDADMDDPVLHGGKDLPEGAFDDEDLVLLANTLPGVLLRKIAKQIPEMPDEIAKPVRKAVEALAPDALLGQAALVDLDEAPAVLTRLRALADAAREFDQRRTFWATAFWIADYVEPRLANRPANRTTPEDAAALVSLSPVP